MKTRDIVIGFIFLVILIAGVLWIFRVKNTKTNNTALPTPTIAQNTSANFPNLNVPAGANRANLTDVSGGQGVGVAIRQKTNGTFSITVMANLPTPPNSYYQAYLTNGTANVSLGALNFTKSGYMVNFTSAKDLSGYNKVIVSLGNTHILEGSF